MSGSELTLGDVARYEQAVFVREFPAPALVILDTLEPRQQPSSNPLEDEKTETYGAPHTPAPGVRGPLSARSRVLHVRKRTNLTSFDDVITLGRSPSQDVVIVLASVSKLHACFTRYPEGWRVTDLRSLNGTFIEGERLPAQVGVPVPEGAEISFGGELRAKFLSAEKVHQLAKFVVR